MLWPRQIGAALVLALGAAGCATGPTEISDSQTPPTPVECVADPSLTAEALASIEGIKQDIDNMLCETANELAADALERYREDGILVTMLDEGLDKEGSDGAYNFNYSDLNGDYVSIDFDLTPDGKPDFEKLKRIHISNSLNDKEGNKTKATEATFIDRNDDGQWTVSVLGFEDESLKSDTGLSYNPAYVEETTDLATWQEIDNKVFTAIIGLSA